MGTKVKMGNFMYYKLDDKYNVVPCSMEEWTVYFEGKHRLLKNTTIKDVVISTIFLGINTSGNKKPFLFESMVFGDSDGDYIEKYTSYDEAIAGHNALVSKMKEKHYPAKRTMWDRIE